MDRVLRLMLGSLLVLLLGGCQVLQPAGSVAKRESLLRPAGLGAESMSLEVYFVRFPSADAKAGEDPIWKDVDEQHVPPEIRRELADNGVRVGLVAGQMPAAVAQLLSKAEQPANRLDAASSFEHGPSVRRHIMQLHSGWRGEIVTSSMYPEMPLLTREDGQVRGQTYPLAQAVLNATTQSHGSRSITLQLTPELRYGQPRQNWVPDDGIIRPTPGKPKRTFERLAFETSLSPGQALLLTCLPERSGTLGHYFFTEPGDGQPQQKLVIMRLAQSRFSDLFSPPPKSPAAQNDQPSLAAVSDSAETAER